MKHFKCSLRMCFPHKVWVKEWQRYQAIHHNIVKCKEKYRIDSIVPPIAYIYDDVVRHRCLVCGTPRVDALKVQGWRAWHICVDGGLIRYRYPNYMGSFKYPQGRCDSIVFDRHNIWFVEFKMNTTTILDKQLWADMKKGMDQIAEFVQNLRLKMAWKHTPLNKFFGINHQHCTVCMVNYPAMSIQRNNELEKFREKTGIKLHQLAVIPYIEENDIES